LISSKESLKKHLPYYKTIVQFLQALPRVRYW
jgi:hypothetical protein